MAKVRDGDNPAKWISTVSRNAVHYPGCASPGAVSEYPVTRPERSCHARWTGIDYMALIGKQLDKSDNGNTASIGWRR
jgi:hypothetical protein